MNVCSLRYLVMISLGADGHVAVVEPAGGADFDQAGHDHDAELARDRRRARGPNGPSGTGSATAASSARSGAGGTCSRRSSTRGS